MVKLIVILVAFLVAMFEGATFLWPKESFGVYFKWVVVPVFWTSLIGSGLLVLILWLMGAY